MKVILQQDVKGQGKKGQLVNVSDGYARNFLLPKKLAVIATAENVNTMKQQEKARKGPGACRARRRPRPCLKAEGADREGGCQGRRGRPPVRRSHRQGDLRVLAEQHGLTIAKTKLVLDEPIKACGGYQIRAKLGYEVTGTVNVMVTEEQ